MRGVAIEADLPGGFSIGGSLEVIASGAMIGTPMAWLCGLVRHRVPIPRPWFGAVVGTIAFGALAAVPPPAAASALRDTPDAPFITAASFGVMFVIWRMSMDVLTKPRVQSVKRLMAVFASAEPCDARGIIRGPLRCGDRHEQSRIRPPHQLCCEHSGR
jgi:hypothetical protein